MVASRTAYVERETQAGDQDAPHRVLVLSADMGGGHNATAAALEETVARIWPLAETRRLDALDVMGPGVGPLFRRIYVGNVERTPWLYEFFYSSLWRHRWFARASKRFTGSWCGRRLVTPIERFDPDLIVSTYPLASSGLAWLRRHRGLTVPVGCWVSDFAPHPFWVYADVDCNFVMHDTAVPVARAAEPGAAVEVSAAPVVSRFAPGDRAAARSRLGLRPDALVVLLSSGAYSFGDAAATARALVDAGPDVQVVAACGRNTAVRRRLERMRLPRESLVPLGWTDDMPGLVQAADMVLTNAGGATALEALACGTPVVTACPIAAHGRANADLMTVAGLTVLCADRDRLTEFVRAAARDRSALEPLRRRTREHTESLDLADGLLRLARPRPPWRPERPARPWRMRPADSFFHHVETPAVGQELGAVLDLPLGRGVAVEELRRVLQPRLDALPPARRELVGGRRPGWRLHERVQVREHVREQVLGPDATEPELWRCVGDFWSRRLPPGRPAWEMLLVRRPDGRALLAVKMHHCQADGISALGLLDRLIEPEPDDALTERRPVGSRATARMRAGLPLAVARGLAALAARGSAPRHPLNQGPVGPLRDLVGVPLPWSEVRALAGQHGLRPHEAVVALVADALDRLLRSTGLLAGDAAGPQSVRAMVPVAMRPPRLDRIAGNWTGSLAVDLPLGPMPFAERARRVRAELRRRAAHGEAPAAAVVMALIGRLPPALQRVVARSVYNDRFFNTVISYMPSARGPRRVAGAPIGAVYPVLPLAPGVPLTVGVVVSDGTAGTGVLLDRELGLDPAQVEDAFRAAFAEAGGRLLTLVPDVTGERAR